MVVSANIAPGRHLAKMRRISSKSEATSGPIACTQVGSCYGSTMELQFARCYGFTMALQVDAGLPIRESVAPKTRCSFSQPLREPHRDPSIVLTQGPLHAKTEAYVGTARTHARNNVSSSAAYCRLCAPMFVLAIANPLPFPASSPAVNHG